VGFYTQCLFTGILDVAALAVQTLWVFRAIIGHRFVQKDVCINEGDLPRLDTLPIPRLVPIPSQASDQVSPNSIPENMPSRTNHFQKEQER
jgi:hypothetical protein